MKRLVFLGIILVFLTCFSSCIFLYDIMKDRKRLPENSDIKMICEDNKYMPLFTSEIVYFYPHKRKDISTTKLAYQFYVSNISRFDNTTIELYSFSFTNKNGDTIPYTLHYKKVASVGREYVLDNTFVKIDTLPFYFDIGKTQTDRFFTILVEAEQLFNKMKEVYISFDITVNNQRITKKNIKYKWKLCVQRFI